MFLIRLLLLPVSFLFGVLVFLRNKFFDLGIFSSKTFEMPVISVGNITVGGTGKTPHVEYLIRMFKDEFEVATLSRGYKRKTKGFLLADKSHGFQDIGDEPLQFHKKYPTVKVAVDEQRVRGVSSLMQDYPDLELVLLDDAYQHRWITPGLNVLLIKYSDIGGSQFMLPSGQLREWRRGRNRADVIIVTKSPTVFSPIEARRITDILSPKPYQKVFYSHVKYLKPQAFNECASALQQANEKFSLSEYKVLLVSGIANAGDLKNYLDQNTKEVVTSNFADHHHFSVADLLRIINEFRQVISTKKVIITTEKDCMRLLDERLYLILKDYPVFFIPIEILIHHNEESFDSLVKEYVRRNKRSR